MGKQSYLILLIFSIIFLQGIAVFLDDNIEESLNLHIRKKRVIDRTRNGGMPVHLSRAPYIVNILKNEISHCAGTILDTDIIVTTPYCIAERPGVTYTILSNSALRNNGTPHHIIKRTSNPAYAFVLVKISPAIELGLNGKIDLFLGYIPPFAYGYFSGWGCTSLDLADEDRFPEHLMQTRLPLITPHECSERYHGPMQNQIICTLDESKRRAGCLGDEGGPLVFENRLLGILLFRGRPAWQNPDIFFNFNNLNIHNWVNFHINILR